jgi:polysaccharide biosynthesis transport protein
MRTDSFAADNPGAQTPPRRDGRARSRNGIVVVPAGGGAHAMPNRPAEAAGLDIGVLLRTLRRRLYIVVAMAVLGGTLGAWAQSKITPRYTSYVEILLDPRRTDTFGAEAQFGSVYVDAAKIASVVSIIESSELLGRVVKQLRLDEDPEFGGQPDSLKHRLFGFLPFVKPPVVLNDQPSREARALGRLGLAVHTDRVGVTYVLTVSASATRPDTAQKLAAAVAAAYLDDQVNRKVAATQRDSAWLGDRLTDARHQLMQSEEAVEELRRKYGLVETDRGSGATTERQTITDLNAQLTQAQTEVAARKARYEQADRTRAAGGSLEGLPEAASSRVIDDLRKSQAEVAARLADLSHVFQDNFPEIRRLKDQQALLQKEINTEIARVVDGLRNEYETAVARERVLNQQLQQISLAANSTSSSDGRVELRDAQRLVEANRGLYDNLLTRWRDVQQQQTREDPEARIISQANFPAEPSSPKPLILPVAGFAAFTLLGLGLTLGPALFDRRFVTVADLERRLGLLVVGSMPLLKRRDLSSARRKVSVFDYSMHKPLSHFAESLRTLRVYLRISADGTPSVLQVTSAVPGEGKSTTAAALAMSAAAAGVRTVLVDVDLRSASLSGMFGLREKEGLADILELGIPAHTVVHELDDMPLAVIGAGSSYLPRPDLVNSRQFEALLDELAKTYHLLILDSPPVLPVSDALVISKHADATILVVEWRATARNLVEQAAKMLRTVNAPLVGAMFNKVDVAKMGGTEYGYQYNYGRRKPSRSGTHSGRA